jgi:hypothetical protein
VPGTVCGGVDSTSGLRAGVDDCDSDVGTPGLAASAWRGASLGGVVVERLGAAPDTVAARDLKGSFAPRADRCSTIGAEAGCCGARADDPLARTGRGDVAGTWLGTAAAGAAAICVASSEVGALAAGATGGPAAGTSAAEEMVVSATAAESSAGAVGATPSMGAWSRGATTGSLEDGVPDDSGWIAGGGTAGLAIPAPRPASSLRGGNSVSGSTYP